MSRARFVRQFLVPIMSPHCNIEVSHGLSHHSTVRFDQGQTIESWHVDQARRLCNGTQYELVAPFAGALRCAEVKGASLVDTTQLLVLPPGKTATITTTAGQYCKALRVTLTNNDATTLLSGNTLSNIVVVARSDAAQVAILLHVLRSRHSAARTLIQQITQPRASAANHVPRRTTAQLIDEARVLLHHNKRLSLTALCHSIGAEPKHLTKQFKRYIGLSLHQYRLRLLLNHALTELPTCRSITDLAFSLGFSSHSHFSTSFCSIYGLTPSRFRELTRTGVCI